MKRTKPLLFVRREKGLLKISSEALNVLLQYRQLRSDSSEAGGVLIGRFIKGSNDIVIDIVSDPCKQDVRSRFKFIRSKKYHQEFIDQHWSESDGRLNYLGEWHSHPEEDPSPSPVDLADWTRKLSEDQIDAETTFFLIVGQATVNVWEGNRSTLKIKPLRRIGRKMSTKSNTTKKSTKKPSKKGGKNPAKKPTTKNTSKRPSIPQNTMLELWSKSGGRCEFRGCNEPLWKDGLTLNTVNLSNIAHIVSWTPKGPRGHPTLSKKLEKDISNLMLVCLKHHKNFDTREYLELYTRERLLEMKAEHEERIAMVTAIESDWKTTVIYAQSYIQGKPIEIDRAKVFKAVIPRYTSNTDGIKIDLGTFQRDGGEEFYKLATDHIASRINEARKVKYRNEPVKHFSVFGLAPIPLMMFMGKCLTDAVETDLYQFHRKTQSWEWPEDVETWSATTLKEEERSADAKQVLLLLSLSDSINREDVLKFMDIDDDNQTAVYELVNDQQSPYFLKSSEQIAQFGEIFRETLNVIKSVHGTDSTIHLFSAVPVPIAVKCGQALLVKKDPSIRVYDYNAQRKGFEFALELNGH